MRRKEGIHYFLYKMKIIADFGSIYIIKILVKKKIVVISIKK